MVLKLNQQNFEAEVLKSELPCLVDFWAPWCGPCKMIAPVIEEIAKEYKGKIKVAKLDVQHAAQIASKFGIISIPTLILFKDGKVAEKSVGALSKESLDLILRRYI